jgi:hypothetical protein
MSYLTIKSGLNKYYKRPILVITIVLLGIIWPVTWLAVMIKKVKNEKRRVKKCEKCFKKLEKLGKIQGDHCPGKSSKMREFCYVKKECFECKFWS